MRYSTIADRIRDRRTTLGRISAGLRIFVIGLSWKVLIADEVAPVATMVFDQIDNPGLYTAWLGLTAYALQIYFDFGGYSNMAIGLALAMGLRFPRNFRLPYGALSVSDFWRRWHMSLSSWFRDYVYIPLGGNRGGHLHTAINLWTVFLLCGLWHGAAWTFLIWGAHHGLFLVLERTRSARGSPGAARAAPCLCVRRLPVRLGLVPRAHAGGCRRPLRRSRGPQWPRQHRHLVADGAPARHHRHARARLAAGHLGLPVLKGRGMPAPVRRLLYGTVDSIVMLLLFALCIMNVGAANYSPFLYFRF